MRNLIHRFTFDKHHSLKNELLRLIDNAPYIKVNDNFDSIGKSDYFIENLQKEYISFIQPHLKEFMTEALRDFNLSGFMMEKMWFQQYYKNDTHQWHTHKRTNLICVYFAEMSDPSQKTQIKHFKSNELIDYEAYEGDIVMFPAFLYHASPVIDTDTRKTIISFNLDITS